MTPLSPSIARPLVNLFYCALGALLLMWPAFYNGQPFFFSDTSAYIRGATMGIEKLTGVTSDWSPGVPTAPPATGDASVPSAVVSADLRASKSATPVPATILAGRSVYYGALLFAGYVAGGFWLTVWLQALLVVAATMALLRSFDLLTPRNLVPLLLLLCLTPAALYSSLLMPDIFGGIAVLATAMLLVAPGAGRARNDWLWFILMTLALLTHTTNVLLCLCMWVAGALALLALRRRVQPRGLLISMAAILLALCGELAFSAGVRHFLGQSPVRPPFLMARVIEDGPGDRYMRTHCAGSELVICRYASRLPMTAYELLWDEKPDRGVFAIADDATKRALAGEQLHFVLAAVAADPWTQIRSSTRNFYNQLVALRASEFTYWEGDRQNYGSHLPARTWAVMQRTRAYNGQIPVKALSALAAVTTLLALVYLAVRGALSFTGAAKPSARMPALIAMVLFGVIANAAVAGCLSEPHNRYQARVIWLVPVMALLLYLELKRTRHDSARGGA